MVVKKSRSSRKLQKKRLLRIGGAFWLLFLKDEGSQTKRTRTVWMKKWLTRREDLGAYQTLLKELREEDTSSYLNFLRMAPGLFDDLLQKVTPYIQKENTNMRCSISPGLRLAITLRYLVTGK